MALIYYGNGDVSIVGHNEIRGVQLEIKGNIEIEKTANDNFAIAQQNNNIIIYPIGEGFLNKLFTYVGELTIISVIAADNNAQSVTTGIKRIFDYAELLGDNAEDLDIVSEKLSAGKLYKKPVPETKVLQKTINKLSVSATGVELYLSDGTKYDGPYYHIHIASSKCMTGAEHTESSQDLYFKQTKDGKIIDKLVPTDNPSHRPQGLQLAKSRYKRGSITRTSKMTSSSKSNGGGY